MYNNYTISQPNSIIQALLNEKNTIALAILNKLIYLQHYNRHVFINQGTLASMFKVSREWVNKLLARLKALGVLFYRQRGFNECCLFSINSLLYIERGRFYYLLPALRVAHCPISLLSSAISERVFTLNNIRNNLYIKKEQTASLSKVTASLGIASLSTMNAYEEKSGSSRIEKNQKEEVMASKEAIRLVAEAYGFTNEQEEQLSNHSDDAIKHAIKEMGKERVKPNLPFFWLNKVAAAFDKRALYSPKKGGMDAFQKKIVYAKANHNHSPSFIPAKNAFMNDLEAADSYRRDDPEYEEHLDAISRDKSDPEGYKRMVRRYDYRRTARKE